MLYIKPLGLILSLWLNVYYWWLLVFQGGGAEHPMGGTKPSSYPISIESGCSGTKHTSDHWHLTTFDILGEADLLAVFQQSPLMYIWSVSITIVFVHSFGRLIELLAGCLQSSSKSVYVGWSDLARWRWGQRLLSRTQCCALPVASAAIFSSPVGRCAAAAGRRPSECRQWTCASCTSSGSSLEVPSASSEDVDPAWASERTNTHRLPLGTFILTGEWKMKECWRYVVSAAP